MTAVGGVVAAQARKICSSRAVVTVASIAVALAALTMTSPADANGGPMFMMAGGAPEVIGGAIGFIGNVIDGDAVAASAARTAFVYTVLWIPVAAVYGVAAFSLDFGCGAARVSKARGASLGASGCARMLASFVPLALFYVAACSASFAFKAAQYGAAAGLSDWTGFLFAACTNALLLCSVAAWSAAIYAVVRGTFGAAIIQLGLAVIVLLGYPSAYGSAVAASSTDPIFPWCLSPVFHLMNVSSLCAQGTGLLAPAVYSVASCTLAFAVAGVALRIREV